MIFVRASSLEDEDGVGGGVFSVQEWEDNQYIRVHQVPVCLCCVHGQEVLRLTNFIQK